MSSDYAQNTYSNGRHQLYRFYRKSFYIAKVISVYDKNSIMPLYQAVQLFEKLGIRDSDMSPCGQWLKTIQIFSKLKVISCGSMRCFTRNQNMILDLFLTML